MFNLAFSCSYSYKQYTFIKYRCVEKRKIIFAIIEINYNKYFRMINRKEM